MAVEKQISNTYQIFKLAWDNLNWTYMAEGPVIPTHDIHEPQNSKDLQKLAEGLINDHMEYLENKGCKPRNHACSNICFSYKLPYESTIRSSEIWRTKKLSPEEIASFEQCAVRAHQQYW